MLRFSCFLGRLKVLEPGKWVYGLLKLRFGKSTKKFFLKLLFLKTTIAYPELD